MQTHTESDIDLSSSNGIYGHFFKRGIDIVLSLIAIIVLSPILVFISILVFIYNGKPIFFRQDRPGLNEKIFTMYKFRTMTNKKDKYGELLPDSMRTTKMGKTLRKLSLDELPELFNVLKGDMSLIGPRPLLSRYLPYYNNKEKLRHTVRPGLSGLAQVSGRNCVKWDERLNLDVEYVKNISLILDIKIVVKTIKVVLKKEGILTVDLSSIKDLDIERSKMNGTKIVELKIQELEVFSDEIHDLLVEDYLINFSINIETAREIVNEKQVLLKKYVNDGSAILIGCKKDNALIGVIWLYIHQYFDEKRIHINHIVVSEKYRNKGIGKRLINEAEKKAKELGASAIDLFVSEINERAVRFYNNLEFKSERISMKKTIDENTMGMSN